MKEDGPGEDAEGPPGHGMGGYHGCCKCFYLAGGFHCIVAKSLVCCSEEEKKKKRRYFKRENLVQIWQRA